MSKYTGTGDQADLDNHANQMNLNNDAYWHSRDEDGRPSDWQDRTEDLNEETEN